MLDSFVAKVQLWKLIGYITSGEVTTGVESEALTYTPSVGSGHCIDEPKLPHVLGQDVSLKLISITLG